MSDAALHEANKAAHSVVRALLVIRDTHYEIGRNRRVRDEHTGELVRLPTRKQAVRLATFHHIMYAELERYEGLCERDEA